MSPLPRLFRRHPKPLVKYSQKELELTKSQLRGEIVSAQHRFERRASNRKQLFKNALQQTSRMARRLAAEEMDLSHREDDLEWERVANSFVAYKIVSLTILNVRATAIRRNSFIESLLALDPLEATREVRQRHAEGRLEEESLKEFLDEYSASQAASGAAPDERVQSIMGTIDKYTAISQTDRLRAENEGPEEIERSMGLDEERLLGGV